MSTIAERAKEPLGLSFYEEPNPAELVTALSLAPPNERQYILRCPLVIPGKSMSIPDEMEWCADFVEESKDYQETVVGIHQPFAYLTIRHGLVASETDDEWHVDGFSMKVPHVPEQNYVWTDVQPTEVISFGMPIPEDFDPLRHNLQQLIQDSVPPEASPSTLEPETIYAMDPYVFHRRPVLAATLARTFLRLSFTPIPIDDVNNHINPAFGNITSSYDGVKDFRDNLERYPL